MKPYFYFLASLTSGTLLCAQAYDNVLPESINTGGTVNVTANCKYAPGNGGGVKEDCLVGFGDGGGFQNFSHAGGESLAIQANLPTGKSNIDIIFTLTKLSVDGGSGLFLRGFHGVTVSEANINSGSLLVAELEDKKGSSRYGDTPVFVFRDDPYGQSASRIDNGSGLQVQNGDILIGKTKLYIGHFSSLEAIKRQGTNSAGNSVQNPTIKNQAHITNYGRIVADTLKNGESITVTGGTPPPGISNQDVSGVIDNYGVMDIKNVDNQAKGIINLRSLDGYLGYVTGMLDNSSGKLNIYVAGARYGEHIIAGTGSTDIDKANIIYGDGASDFITAQIATNGAKITISKKQDRISAFRQGFNGSQRSMLDVLDSRFNIYTYGGGDFVKKVVNESQKGVYSSYLSAPFVMLEGMKPKYTPYSTGLDLKLIANGFFGSDVGVGGLGGLNTSYGARINNHNIQYQLGYGYGLINNAQKNYDANIGGHIISLGARDGFTLGDRLEVDASTYALMGLFNSMQTIKIASSNLTSPTSKTNFSIFNFGADASVGYRRNFGIFSLKPFVGLNQALSIRGKLAEKGGFNSAVPMTASYMAYLSAGLENKLMLANERFVYTKIGYEYMVINTQNNFAINMDGTNVFFKTPFTNKFMLDLGGEIPFGRASLITLGAFYNNAIVESIHHFGGNVSYKLQF